MMSVLAARELAQAKLETTLPRRWKHVRSVARRARRVADSLELSDDLECAAWLHDIGYAPDLAFARFHPLDGARYLRGTGADETVISLVAYHSCASIEARVRGMDVELASEFSLGDPALTDALLYCDMTTGPDGEYVRPADRLAEIRSRYGPDDEVTRFVELAAPEILDTATRIEQLLAARPSQAPARP
jgi:HD domain